MGKGEGGKAENAQNLKAHDCPIAPERGAAGQQGHGEGAAPATETPTLMPKRWAFPWRGGEPPKLGNGKAPSRRLWQRRGWSGWDGRGSRVAPSLPKPVLRTSVSPYPKKTLICPVFLPSCSLNTLH